MVMYQMYLMSYWQEIMLVQILSVGDIL